VFCGLEHVEIALLSLYKKDSVLEFICPLNMQICTLTSRVAGRFISFPEAQYAIP
jgi:hypothetical protein